MATGTEVAMHAAGVTLMRGDLRLVAAAIRRLPQDVLASVSVVANALTLRRWKGTAS